MAIRGHRNFGLKLGPTGEFPQGRLNETDRGEVSLAVSRDGDNVRVDFGTDLSWLAMSTETTIEFAKALLGAAGVTYEIDE
jgi:hypothetical protein